MPSKAKTPTGRVVQHAVKRIRTNSPVGRIVVTLGAQVGGALGDGVHRTFVNPGQAPTDGETEASWRADDESRRARRDRYVEEALREQREKRRRAEEAYRRAQGDPGNSGGGPRSGNRDPRHANGAPRHEDPRAETNGNRQTSHPRHYNGRPVADYYEVLEVSPNARQSVIDRAYRALMREDHPDLGGDPRKAQLINEAYEVLHDPHKRRRYDEQNGIR